jgi:conjugative transfer signal peptidase TraF
MSILYAIDRARLRPRRPQWERLLIPVIAMALAALAANLAYWSGWRVQLTESEPMGLYRLHALQADEVIQPGQEVEFCPPPSVTPAAFPFYMSGDCPAGGMAMMKTVVGVPGDRVVTTMAGVWVNGHRLPYSGQLVRSTAYPWVRLPHQIGSFVLGPRQYWVYGSGASPPLAAQSFDSRYWGPVARSEIRRVVY